MSFHRRVLALAALFVVGALETRQASASELDAKGALHSVTKGALMIGFDDAPQLAALGATLLEWRGDPWNAQIIQTPIVDSSSFTGRTVDASLVLEGKGALRFGGKVANGAHGIAIPGKSILAAVASNRFEITFWGRAEGASPYLTVSYANGGRIDDGFIGLYAIRTGRETDDGWAEFTTGTIDREVWGVPLSSVRIMMSAWVQRNAGFAVDALEVVPVAGSGVAPVACTQADVDRTCGPEGDCQYGRCVPGYAAWGPLPPRAHREQMVQRWIHLATRIHGDRATWPNAKALATEGPALAWYSTSARPFFAGMKRLTNALRDQHTSMGGPSASLLQPIAYGGGSATVGACFGPGRHDLIADGGPGKLGFVVYRANKNPPTGVLLRPGDALTKIDGMDPMDWVRTVWGTYSHSLPNDPGADFAWVSTGLAWLIEKRASTIEITRCDSDVRCDGSHRTVRTIDVATPLYERIKGTGNLGDLSGYFWCDLHFQYAIDKFAPPVPGENTISSQVVRKDVLSVHFDGTYGVDKWVTTLESLFPEKGSPTKVLFDTRQGNGGHLVGPNKLLDLLRPSSEPTGFLRLANGAWDGAEPASLFKAYEPCELAFRGFMCRFGEVWFTTKPAPPGAHSKVAFLNTADVSANDFLARLVKGRSNLKLFGPAPTSGAFGSVSSVPPLLHAWGGGRMQMEDTRFATTFAGFADAPWASGTGVTPDVLVAQTMSDAIRDRDTVVEAAHAWLAGGPGWPEAP